MQILRRVAERYAPPGVGLQFGRLCCPRHGSGRVCLGTWFPSGLRGPSLPALTLFGGVWLIAWRPSWGECRQGPRYFSKCWTRVGSGPAPGAALKKALCHTFPVVGRITNNETYRRYYQLYILTLFLFWNLCKIKYILNISMMPYFSHNFKHHILSWQNPIICKFSFNGKKTTELLLTF